MTPSPRRPHPLSPAMSAACLALLCAGLLMPAPLLASDAPPPKPAKVGKAGKPATTSKAAAPASGAESEADDAAPTDPLEQLRLRLAERLSAARTSQAGGPYDLRISARSGAAAAPADHAPKPTGAGHKSPRVAGGPEAKGTAAHAPHWSYQGGAGPAAWGGLKPEFSLCKTGERQSPIDIRGGLAVDLDPVRFDYQASPFSVLDNGHTVQVELAPGNSIDVGGKRFELKQFHFHRPSEERIDGRQFEMSLHLVHKDAQGRLAVVALLFDKGPAHPVLQQVWANLPLERGEAAAARAPLELSSLLPADRRYYTYMGSLTTPPCSEGVQWIVMRHPVTLTPEQIEIFARIYPMNARPLQAASGRRILQSN